MARKVSPSQVERALQGKTSMRKSKYPWEEWADGDWWELLDGVDFTATVRGMVSTIHNHAAREGLVADTHRTEDGLYVRFRKAGGS